MTSVRRIAEYAGVSISTVSLVINGKPGVSEKTRRAVQDAIRQLEAQSGTRRPTRRSGAPANEMRTFSFMVLHPPVISSYYVFSQVLHGIQSAAETNMVQLRLVSNDPDMADDHIAHQYLADPKLRPDGLLIFGAHEAEPLLNEALYHGIPCVVLGREVDKYSVSGIGRKEIGAAYQATQYLVGLGHRAIAFVGGEEGFDYVRNRLNGYQRGLRNSGVKPAPAWVSPGDGMTATLEVLERAPEITAILYVNDSYAAGGLLALRELGLRIPGDLSVMSFDNTDIARNAKPPLTSISYQFFQEGQWAVKMLLDQIHNPFLETVHVFCKAKLVKRLSCAAPGKR